MPDKSEASFKLSKQDYGINPAMYNTVHGTPSGLRSSFVSKWNTKYTDDYRESNRRPSDILNRGASFLVAPSNLTYNMRAKRASESNHVRVVDQLQGIISKHEAKEAKKTRGMTLEQIKQREKQQPVAIKRTQKLLDQISSN